MNQPIRIGQGYDIHRFAEGRKLVLGGVDIPHELGLEGHSDADCLAHAIADALLGSLGLADIGNYFPTDDIELKGIDSMKILLKAKEECDSRNYEVGNVDATIIAEAPKMAPHIPAMKKRLAEILSLAPEQIGVKAATNEEIGGIGRSEGIAVHAICLMVKKTN